MLLNAWSRRIPVTTRSDEGLAAYQHGNEGVGFERLLALVDGVFAIVITLLVIEIAVPTLKDGGSAQELIDGVMHSGPHLAAYLAAFLWIAFYWRANHQFTMTLKAMNTPFVLAMLLYVGIVGLLPWFAGILGTYGQNPVAIVMFGMFALVMSTVELVLWLIASHHNLFVEGLTFQSKRRAFLGSFLPIPIFIASIPLAFVSTVLAFACWAVVALVGGALVSKRAIVKVPVAPPCPGCSCVDHAPAPEAAHVPQEVAS